MRLGRDCRKDKRMGWAGGSELAETVWEIVKNHIPKDSKKRVAKRIVAAFEHHDCDTICEVEELCKLAHDHSEDEYD
jgi:hypothetical protein